MWKCLRVAMICAFVAGLLVNWPPVSIARGVPRPGAYPIAPMQLPRYMTLREVAEPLVGAEPGRSVVPRHRFHDFEQRIRAEEAAAASEAQDRGRGFLPTERDATTERARVDPDPASEARDRNGNGSTRRDAPDRRARAEDERGDEDDKGSDSATTKKGEKAKPRWVNVSTQPWTNKIGGRIFWDLVQFPYQSPENIAFYGDAPNYIQFRSLRPTFHGSGWGVYEYMLQLEFGPAPDIPPYPLLVQAWVGIREVPCLGFVQIGQQRVPLGMENYTSQQFTTFLEYALPTTTFFPGFRAGVQQTNQFFHDQLLAQTGLYQGESLLVTKEFVGDEQGIRLVGRGVWTPVYALQGRSILHLGASWEYSTAPTRRFIHFPATAAGVRFLEPGLFRLDRANTAVLEFFAMNGSRFLQSELYAGMYEGLEFGVGRANAFGAYVQGGWFLTGEHRGYNRARGAFDRVVPLTNFWLVHTAGGIDAGWGAWQVALRWDYVDLTQLAHDNPQRTFGTLHDITLGVNWYWNPHSRVMFNYTHSMPNARRGLGDYVASHAGILALRFQVDW